MPSVIIVFSEAAGADPEYAFGDLANLTRMARIDLGIEIEVGQEDPRALKPDRRTKLSGRHVVVGEIRYEAERAGKLVYIKASRTRNDPHDLRGYQKGRPAFPHETTVDQFFAEEQFESYRELGYRCGLAAADAIEEEGLLQAQVSATEWNRSRRRRSTVRIICAGGRIAVDQRGPV